MLKNIKAFINVQFKISEVEDDVYSSSESEEDEQEQEESKGDEESDVSDFIKPKKEKATIAPAGGPTEFPKAFIFSCIGIGLTNIARKME